MRAQGRLLDFEAALRGRVAECRPCEGCGEPGTWSATNLCPDCELDSRSADGERQRASTLAQIEADRRAALLICGVPKRQAQLDFREPSRWPHDNRLPDLTLDRWAGEPWSVLLTGATGTRKTTLATEIAYRFRCLGHSVRFVRAGQVPGVYYRSDSRSETSSLETVELLVLDDYGRGHDGNAWSALGELIATRYDQVLPTIATSNSTLQQIAEHDSHAADRLFEGLVIALEGDSLRELNKPETQSR